MSEAPTRRTVTSLPDTQGSPVELAVFESGRRGAPCVVLVHGWPDTHRLWDGVAALLSEGLHVVSYDVRGHGESSRVPAVEDLELGALARDLFAVIDAVSPDAPVHLVGHDWGSVQAWEAVCEPGASERIASFTSISGPNLDHLALWVRDRFAHPSPRNVVQPLAQGASSLYTAVFMTPVGPWLFSRIASPARWSRFLRLVDEVPQDPTRFAPTFREDIVNGLRIYRANIPRLLRHPRERRTSVPVLQLVPTRDIAVRAASFADTPLWAEDVRRVEVPRGHWVPLSAPEVVAAEVSAFIAETQPVPSTPRRAAGSRPRRAPARRTAPAAR